VSETSEVISFFSDEEGEATPETQVREVTEEAAEEAPAPLADVFTQESGDDTQEEGDEAAPEPDLAADLGLTEEPTALKDRISTVTRQRREARAEAAKAKEALEVATTARTEAEQRLEKLGLLEPLAKSYERFGDKAAEQATRDVTMLEVLEELSGTDQSVNAVAQRLVAEANRRLGNPTTPARPPPPPAPKPSSASRSLVCSSPWPSFSRRCSLFRATLKDKLLAEVPAEQVTAAKVKEFAREYVAENGLTQADVLLGQGDPSAKKKGNRPPTKGTRARGAARSTRPGPSGDEDPKREAPKNLNELNADRRKRISAMFGESR
jgi:hypothetical protein